MSLLGIVQHSYTESWKPNSGSKFNNAVTFLEDAASIGAAGVQVAIRPEEHPNAEKIRARAEALGVWFEGNVGLPRDDAGLALFEANLKAAAAAGASLVRTACLSGRRYETFKTLAEFRQFKETSVRYLTAADPFLKKYNLKLAFENHKDWLAAEHLEILRGLSSERIGATIDTGNNIALLEDPYGHLEALAPFALTCHLKDMALGEYDQGFLLSEVVLGSGWLDIGRVVATLRKANPKIRFNLEMITRDPLKVPCLTSGYYATFEALGANRLAGTLATVKKHRVGVEKLPKTTGLTAKERMAFEDGNVRECLKWAEGKFTA